MTLKSMIRSALDPLIDPLARKWLPRNVSYASAGEDLLVLSWLENVYRLDVRNVRYLDIGANHPTRLSNTFLLYRLGASGVLVEPDPNLSDELRSKRPRDVLVAAGIAFDERRNARLKRMTANVFNTFSPDRVETIVNDSRNWKEDQRQEQIDEIDVPLIPANDILTGHFSSGIDYISIDTEGVELEILRSIDFARFRPKMICIEASAGFDPILLPLGYQLTARTPDNLIYRFVEIIS